MISVSNHIRARTKAFTLIEVLVVIVIIAIITGVAVMAFGHFGRGRREAIIAEQFTRILTVASQQAILTPAVLGLGISATGYQFYQYELPSASEKGHWRSLGHDVLSNPHAFKNVFHTTVKSIATYATSQDKSDLSPAILFLPSGYVTPFTLELKGNSHTFNIDVKNNGVVTLRTM